MTLAHAMEHINLHRRLALFVLSFVGSSIKWFEIVLNRERQFDFSIIRSMAGLMCVTAFLSMWINNSAATSIMMPAAIAIVDELENYGKKTFLNRQQSHEILPINTESKRICLGEYQKIRKI
jgi:sodium-dependent dicarboxylate transporter 2/3/5